MRTKVKRTSPEIALARILDTLAQELIDASDEEVLQAAKDLGMDPRMRESAAFAGVTYFARPQLSDFLDLEGRKKLRSKRIQISTDRKTPGDK